MRRKKVHLARRAAEMSRGCHPAGRIELRLPATLSNRLAVIDAIVVMTAEAANDITTFSEDRISHGTHVAVRPGGIAYSNTRTRNSVLACRSVCTVKQWTRSRVKRLASSCVLGIS